MSTPETFEEFLKVYVHSFLCEVWNSIPILLCPADIRIGQFTPLLRSSLEDYLQYWFGTAVLRLPLICKKEKLVKLYLIAF